ncbi:MAG: hypothetical protein M3550_12775, partial [Actinomycetota bacterium]|nr:hypothetical protein [Actinomycetota bacterium]
MKPSQILLAVLAAIAVAVVAVISTGGGGGGGDSSETSADQPKAPANAVRLPFAYSPEKEKLLVPL